MTISREFWTKDYDGPMAAVTAAAEHSIVTGRTSKIWCQHLNIDDMRRAIVQVAQQSEGGTWHGALCGAIWSAEIGERSEFLCPFQVQMVAQNDAHHDPNRAISRAISASAARGDHAVILCQDHSFARRIRNRLFSISDISSAEDVFQSLGGPRWGGPWSVGIKMHQRMCRL